MGTNRDRVIIIPNEAEPLATVVVEAPGAKNAFIPLLYAATSCRGMSKFSNAPTELGDSVATVGALASTRVFITENPEHVSVSCDRPIELGRLSLPIAQKTRYSSLFLGLGAAIGQTVTILPPGGCKLGRSLDIHIAGLRALGHTIEEQAGAITLVPATQTGSGFYLRSPSVGATLNLLIAALGSQREVSLENIAIEPEVLEVVSFLNQQGLEITLSDQRTLHVTPGTRSGREWSVRPDRIAIGTYLIAGALLQREVSIRGVEPGDLTNIVTVLAETGLEIAVDGRTCTQKMCDLTLLRPFAVATGPHPGFPTDMQPLMAALASRIQGESHIIESVYTDRFQYARMLRDMGVSISFPLKHRITITGSPLQNIKNREIRISCPDIRGGMACILYGLTHRCPILVEQFSEITRGYVGVDSFFASFGFSVREH